MSYFLYILKSKTADKFYIGISQNPEIRLKYHNTFEKGFTSRYCPWEIVFTKKFSDKSLAAKAEKKVKSWKSKKMINLLIKNKIKL